MTEDPARLATVSAALDRVKPGMTLGLGSGRAVFALARQIGERFGPGGNFRAVVASPETALIAEVAGMHLTELVTGVRLDVAFDGADELDHQLNMIKGGGAALVREKLVLAAANHVVILAEAPKLVENLGSTHTLPVEVVPFAWTQTQERVAQIVDNPALRAQADGKPIVTANGNFLLDGHLQPGVDLAATALALKSTLGVVDHGLFLTEADEVLLGNTDGEVRILTRDP